MRHDDARALFGAIVGADRLRREGPTPTVSSPSADHFRWRYGSRPPGS